MKNIIALAGSSGVGKTTIARLLAASLGAELRSCGELIKERAKLLNVPVNQLPQDEHQRLDAETVSFVSTCTHLTVVEGRFLDLVLQGTGALVIKVVCSEEVRKNRLAERERNTLKPSFTNPCLPHLTNNTGNSDAIVIDNTLLTLEETVFAIIAAWKKYANRAD